MRTFQMYHSRRGCPDGETRAEGRATRGNRQRKRRQKIRTSPRCSPKTYFPSTSILMRSCWFGGKNLVDGSHSDCKRKTLEPRGNNNLRHEKLSRSTFFVEERLNLGSGLKTNPPIPLFRLNKLISATQPITALVPVLPKSFPRRCRITEIPPRKKIYTANGGSNTQYPVLYWQYVSKHAPFNTTVAKNSVAPPTFFGHRFVLGRSLGHVALVAWRKSCMICLFVFAQAVKKENAAPGFTMALNGANPIPLPTTRVSIDWESKLATEVTRRPKNHLGSAETLAKWPRRTNISTKVGAARIRLVLFASHLRNLSSIPPFSAACVSIWGGRDGANISGDVGNPKPKKTIHCARRP